MSPCIHVRLPLLFRIFSLMLLHVFIFYKCFTSCLRRFPLQDDRPPFADLLGDFPTRVRPEKVALRSFAQARSNNCSPRLHINIVLAVKDNLHVFLVIFYIIENFLFSIYRYEKQKHQNYPGLGSNVRPCSSWVDHLLAKWALMLAIRRLLLCMSLITCLTFSPLTTPFFPYL